MVLRVRLSLHFEPSPERCFPAWRCCEGSCAAIEVSHHQVCRIRGAEETLTQHMQRFTTTLRLFFLTGTVLDSFREEHGAPVACFFFTRIEGQVQSVTKREDHSAEVPVPRLAHNDIRAPPHALRAHPHQPPAVVSCPTTTVQMPWRHGKPTESPQRLNHADCTRWRSGCVVVPLTALHASFMQEGESCVCLESMTHRIMDRRTVVTFRNEAEYA